MSKIPGGAVARRPLHFILIPDRSGSMNGLGKIQSLNTAVREAIPAMLKTAGENPHAQVFVRVVAFGTSARWVDVNPTPLEHFRFTDLIADGETAMGEALSLVAAELDIARMPPRGLPPVLVLISDGKPSDDFEGGLKKLLAQGWGKKAAKIAVAIGKDADEGVLQKFIDNAEIKPLRANNAEALVKYIKWASTAVLKAASSPVSQSASTLGATPAGNVPIPAPPAATAGAAEVW